MAILSPDWIAGTLLEVAEVEAELALSEGYKANIRFRHQNIVFEPTQDRVIIRCVTASEESILQAERLAIKLMSLLTVTPITAVGINFGFREPDPNRKLLSILNFSDATQMAEMDVHVDAPSLSRKLTRAGQTINLSISQSDNGEVALAFNFHSDARTTDIAIAAIQGHSTAHMETSLALLSGLYDLELEEP